MANQALAAIETALRARKLDRTFTSALPPLARSDPAAFLPTDIAALDRALGGGLPRGQLSELTAVSGASVSAAPARTAGRTTVLLQMIAAATARGELAAVVDTCDELDVASVVAARIDLDRVLWIRGDTWGAGLVRPAASVERAVNRALKALNLVLQAGGFGLVALDLADIPAMALKRLPFTTWLRVQRTLEGSDTACVLVVPEPIARSAGGLTLTLDARPQWAGASPRSRRWTGLDIGIRIVSPRRRVGGTVTVRAVGMDE